MVVSILAKIKSKKNGDYFIILGGGLDQKYLLENVKSLGYKIILFDKNKNCFASKQVDLFLNIDFQNYKKIIFELKKFKKIIFNIMEFYYGIRYSNYFDKNCKSL